MTDSLRLGRVLGIPIGMNWTIVAVALLFTGGLALQAFPLAAPDDGLGLRLTAAGVAVFFFFASILAHELGHAVAALSHGVGVHGITLWLLGGVAKLDRQAPTARAEFQIAVAGPAISFGLGIFFIALTIILLALWPVPLVVAVVGWLGGVNLILAVFNLLPAAPLDGGRVLTALLWKRLGDAEQARIIAGRCGLFLAVILVVVGLVQIFAFGQFGGWVTILIGAFSFTAARGEIAMAAVRRRLLTTPIRTVTTLHPPTVPDTMTIGQLVSWAGPAKATTAHAVVRWGVEPIGYVVPAEAAEGRSAAEQSWTRVGQAMHGPEAVDTVAADRSVDELLRRWEAGSPMLAVVVEGPAPDRPTARTLGTVTDHQIRPLLASPDLWGRDRDPKPPPPAPVPTGGGAAPTAPRPLRYAPGR